MDWFSRLRTVLSAYYPEARDAQAASNPIVGYLQGSRSPEVWQRMIADQGRNQQMILGNVPPTREEWAAAGVAGRGMEQVIRLSDLRGFIVLYNGFILRPWGRIHLFEPGLQANYETQLQSFRYNMPRRR